MSTLTVPHTIPSVTQDCEQLRKAFAGWGTNEGLIISILAHRNAEQRKLIRQTYAETYGEDLLKALDKELSNDFEDLLDQRLSPPRNDVVEKVFSAMKLVFFVLTQHSTIAANHATSFSRAINFKDSFAKQLHSLSLGKLLGRQDSIP